MFGILGWSSRFHVCHEVFLVWVILSGFLEGKSKPLSVSIYFTSRRPDIPLGEGKF